MKILQHPGMKDIVVGDEVVCHSTNLYARVEEVFPAAVCVRIALVRRLGGRPAFATMPQLWRADDIENLSVCRYCGSREELRNERSTGVPYRVCATCRSVLSLSPVEDLIAELTLP